MAWSPKESFSNSCIIFTKEGDTIFSESRFLVAKLEKDTISVGDSVKFIAEFCPAFENSIFVIKLFYDGFRLDRFCKHIPKFKIRIAEPVEN